jgi:hypothetical protein
MKLTPDRNEQIRVSSAVLTYALRGYLEDFPGDPVKWLENIIKAVLA